MASIAYAASIGVAAPISRGCPSAMELIKVHGPGDGKALCKSGFHALPSIAGTVHTAISMQVKL